MEKRNAGILSHLIRDEVKAQMKRYAMAQKRENFVNRLVEVLIPALKHHYRAALGILNDRTDQVEKWRRHEDAYLDQFDDRLQEATKARGLDRRKAVAQALRELMEHDGARRRGESASFQRAHGLKTLKPLPDEAHEEFLARVREIVDRLYPA
jgi:hypothetical protein